MSRKQRISYFPLEKMDAQMQKEMERCKREGTPRPESSAVRAHVPAAFWAFANSWRDLFHKGVCDHPIKELCRLYVSRSVQCDYCGNQRSIKAAGSGVVEEHVKDLLNFEESSARVCRGDHLASRYRRCVLGTSAAAFQRARAGRARLLHRAHHGAAKLAAAAQHRAPPGARRHHRVDGAGLRNRGSAAPVQVGRRLLGEARLNVKKQNLGGCE